MNAATINPIPPAGFSRTAKNRRTDNPRWTSGGCGDSATYRYHIDVTRRRGFSRLIPPRFPFGRSDTCYVIREMKNPDTSRTVTLRNCNLGPLRLRRARLRSIFDGARARARASRKSGSRDRNNFFSSLAGREEGGGGEGIPKIFLATHGRKIRFQFRLIIVPTSEYAKRRRNVGARRDALRDRWHLEVFAAVATRRRACRATS